MFSLDFGCKDQSDSALKIVSSAYPIVIKLRLAMSMYPIDFRFKQELSEDNEVRRKATKFK